MPWIQVIVIGASVGFLAGVFGKGGSALATPLLHTLGIPAIVALAAPFRRRSLQPSPPRLAYGRRGIDNIVALRWSLAFGVPATVIGAVCTRWIGGGPLVLATDVIVALLGVRFLVAPGAPKEVVRDVPHYRPRLALVATVAGMAGGLLANSGGFLLAPLYLAVLRMPIKRAFATSLVVSAALAVPGTIVHWALGHIDWPLVAVFGAASIPLSFVGGRVAVRSRPERLERIYGFVLASLGTTFLVMSR